MSIRKYIREQISKNIISESDKLNSRSINKQTIVDDIILYNKENPHNQAVYINDISGEIQQDSDRIIGFILNGNPSIYYLERVLDSIGKKLSDYEYDKTIAKRGYTDTPDVDPGLYGSLDEGVLCEALTDKIPFEKIIFNMDLVNVNSTFRLALMNKIKEYKGEGLKTDKDKVWYTFVPQKDVQSFKREIKEYNPIETGETEMFSEFKPLTKELKDGEKISFLNYDESEVNPPLTVGYLKPGFINPHKSLLKYSGGEMWITNKNIDSNYFYHRDFGDIENKYTKVFFSIDFDTMDPMDKKELIDTIKKYKGITRLVSGARKASGGQEYALIPADKFNEFYSEAERFDPYEGEMELDSIREDAVLSEARKIVRSLFLKILK